MDNGNGRDNGGVGDIKQIPLTPEELAIKKREAFNKNPDEFIHLSELVIGTRVLSNGQIQCIVGNPNQLLLEISVGRIQYEVFKTLMVIERASQSKIVQPKHGIMDFVRRR